MVASIQAQFPQSRIFGKFMVEVADKPVFRELGLQSGKALK